MKILTKLPRVLRLLFGFLRVMTVVLGVFWILTLAYNTWIQKRTGQDASLMATIGEISLPATSGPVALASDTATPAALKLQSLRGVLQVDLCSNDAALVSALRQSIIPAMAALIIFSYVLFTALRNVCANLERGDVFNEQNLCLVRRIGGCLIAYGLVGAGLETWVSSVLGGYFGRHVTLTGLKGGIPFPTGSGWSDFFHLPVALFTTQGELLTGCLVLLVAEAFRQGLNLKAENDLTV